MAPGSTAAASPTGAAGGPWQALDEFPASGAFVVTSAAATIDGFVAVGFGAMPDGDYYGPHQGIVWRSADGSSWTAQADTAFQFVTPEAIVPLGPALYVVGEIATCGALVAEGCTEPPDAGWAVWRSTAGGPWERLAQLPQMQHGLIDGAMATDTELVVFGATGEAAVPVIWASADGESWTAQAQLPPMSQVTAVAAGGENLTAFGTVPAGDFDIQLTVATAPDGISFTPAAAPALAGTSIRAAASGSNGLVAVGEAQDMDLRTTAVTLHSADGATWAQGTATDGSFANRAAWFVHALEAGYLALGFEPAADDFGLATGVAWLSGDGQEWRELGTFGEKFETLSASASGDAGSVVFTATSEEIGEESVASTVRAWFAPAGALASQ